MYSSMNVHPVHAVRRSLRFRSQSQALTDAKRNVSFIGRVSLGKWEKMADQVNQESL